MPQTKNIDEMLLWEMPPQQRKHTRLGMGGTAKQKEEKKDTKEGGQTENLSHKRDDDLR